ncbi:putative bifunctional diguanylate cyclase/phosphodiesterase [Rhizobium lentis]|uniref:Diguanylate cyclase (GGDEF)-like protein/PAS domain S-box-containing protein n=1 Tax=Rhizobium lentis TaxID=1138194 RepID=A0A7W8UQC8_9HYPH|nr:diguanylate cyclase (GGDEF)-like protein/PAS domain S-box-containing protein [Rhizobium lentis]MBB5561462.1 diguanylate cyclase (GGDEF)-like protein/PAS domain S-box-containing protein [Rhizobium lentis]MBB5568046.1 diguanylate cyclase (GGDEF)-like protein/PAS domain S-box-containing protein [Rhizobium lentis]
MSNKLSRTNVELENLLRQLGLALEASGVGIWQHNIAKNQTRWDEQLKSIYGVSKAPLDVIWLDSIHPDDLVAANEIFLRAIETRSDYASEFRIIRPDGATRYLRSRARYFIDAAGDPCFVGAEWDVTDDVLLNKELERSRAEARFAADHDHLTGLLNRRSFDFALSELARQENVKVALLHIDVDHFKEINDRFGHAVGDLVLCHVSKTLLEAISAGDVAARLGGDEFAVVITEDECDRITAVLDHIQRRLDSPLPVGDQTLIVRCSIGVASAMSADFARLLSQSDLALYHAKRNGRNRAEIFSDEMASTLANERQLAQDLRSGLTLGQIRPFYQVQVDARSFRVNGVEALARWHHPARGVLAPADFLSIASSNGLVAELDDVVLKAVLSDMKSAASPLEGIRVSVNLSADRLDDPELTAKLTGYDIPPGRLSFELIETIFLDSLSDQVRQNIQAIKSLGIDIEIDDLGSGHASLLGLLELRPDRVKIDRQLVTPILQSVPSRRLVGSLVDIARALDMEVIAEGVETLEHANVLAALGVHTLQGYAFGRPQSFADLSARLEQEIFDCERAEVIGAGR